jgi:hypothetical protein
MIDPSVPSDPNAPTRKLSHEVTLWAGFGLCLLIALLTVVLPELSGGAAREPHAADAAKKPTPVAPPAR